MTWFRPRHVFYMAGYFGGVIASGVGKIGVWWLNVALITVSIMVCYFVAAIIVALVKRRKDRQGLEVVL